MPARPARLIAALTAAALAGAAVAQGPRTHTTPRTPAAARAQVSAGLDRLVTVELTESRLADVVQFIQDFSGVPIEAMWMDDTSASGLDRDRPITISVREMRTADFLQRVLDRASDPFDKATWQHARDISGIEIGPRSRLNAHAYMKIYDIQDLVFVIPNFENAPELDLDQVLNQGQQGGGGGGGSIFQDDDGDPVGPREEELVNQLRDIIVENIEPEQWLDSGGSGATIRFYNGSFIIRAPEYIHRQLDPRTLPARR